MRGLSVSATNRRVTARRAHQQHEVFCMMEKEAEKIEKLAEDAEINLSTDYDKRDLKERRGAMKGHLYDGSKKLKHSVPKGKRV